MRHLAAAGTVLLACLFGFAPTAQARAHHGSHTHHHRHRTHHHRAHHHPRTAHTHHRRGGARIARVAPRQSAMVRVVLAAAQRHGVPSSLALGVASVESGFNPHARSRSGAVGLMQILPSTARGLGCRGSLASPSVNADCGTRYLAAILSEHGGNMRVAAAMYNQGRFARGVSRGGGRYAALVMRHARRRAPT